MNHITLHSGEKVKVDRRDFKRLSQHKWYLSNKGYAVRNRKANETGQLRMHRDVMAAKDGDIVDHINRDKLDNRRSNLRFVSHGENRRNSKANSTNKLGIKNISAKKCGGYQLEMRIDGVRMTKYSKNLDVLLELKQAWEAQYGV